MLKSMFKDNAGMWGKQQHHTFVTPSRGSRITAVLADPVKMGHRVPILHAMSTVPGVLPAINLPIWT